MSTENATPRTPDCDEHARISAARYLAIRHQPYLATALLAMRPVMAPGLDTFAVDRRWRLYIDPGRLYEWNIGEVAAVLLHEVNHLIRGHDSRLRCLSADPDEHQRWVWNIAADCAINDDIAPSPAGTLQTIGLPCGVFPADFGFEAGQLEERYYAQLLEQIPTPPQSRTHPGCGGGSGVDAGHDPLAEQADALGIDGITPSPASIIRRQVRHEINSAADRQPGSVPAGLQLWANADGPPIIDWRHQLRRSVRRGIRAVTGWNETTWRRPTRRQAPGAFIRPGSQRRVPNVTVIIDTSASMTDALDAAVTEVNGVLNANRLGDVRTLSCDTNATESTRVRSATDIELVGGGGTDLREGFNVALEHEPRPDLIIAITDGYTPWPPTHPPCSVLVLLIGNGPEPPRYTTVRIPEPDTTRSTTGTRRRTT